MKYFLISAVLILGYLNRSYAYFYDYQGDHFIGNPSYPSTHLIHSEEKAETKKLVVLGDSLMAGTGSTHEENSMAYLAAKSLSEEQNIEMYNFSSPGVGVDDVLTRQIPEVVKINPDYIILTIGTNDVHAKMATSEFADYYTKILGELEKNTKAKITVVNIPYIGSHKILMPPWNKILNWRIGVFNKIIASSAEAHNLSVVNLHKEFIREFSYDSDLYAGDKFHPSDKGYALWAKYLNENLNR